MNGFFGKVVLVGIVLAFGLAAYESIRAGEPEENRAGLRDTWCGVRIAPEQACPTYSGRNWPYAADLDVRHAEAVGGYFAPYTRRVFDHAGQVDIEHIVPRHEAAKSGACGWPRERKREFANDALEITIAGPMVNRRLKSDRDPSEWMPEYGREWYAARWVRIKRKYGLSADPAEVAALDAVLGGRCP